MSGMDYKSAGVDIHAGNEAVRRIKKAVESTFSPYVLSSIGGFGAMYDLKPLLKQYHHPVLVQSIDGVGTKMMIANMMQHFDTIGTDLVSATVNDIIVIGAKPLTLLDYIANDRLDPDAVEKIVKSIVAACLQHDISLVGGEMAEMPGTYAPGEYDLVGIVTGVVEKDAAISGKNIEVGDIVVAFPSSGLHTNGYSLARKLFFEVGGYKVDSMVPDLMKTLGEALLMPHINYSKPILSMLEDGIPIRGMAHITGGGLLENIPRVLPEGCAVEIRKEDCPTLPIFNMLSQLSGLGDEELYRTFNMGVGMVMIIPSNALAAMQTALTPFLAHPLYEIGHVVPGERGVKLV